MPIIKKEIKTKIRIKNCDNLFIFKFSTLKNWYVKFYVGRNITSHGMIEKSLRTTDKETAKRLAKELWFKTKSEHNLSVFKTINSEYVFDKIANDFFNSQDEDYKTRNDSSTTPIRERSKYQRVIKKELGNLDIRQINYSHLEKIRLYLISQNKSSSTISRYFDCIRKILNYAKRLTIISLIPSIPKIERHDKNSYAPYTKDEVNQITKELRNQNYNEIADVINFLSFTQLRAGKEYLSLRHHDISFLKHFKTKQDILIINPPHRKVMLKKQPIPTHPIIAEIYKNRICKRYPKHTSEDFIFYPNENNRERVRRLIYDVFIRTSKKLNLFVCSRTKMNRPLYSLRSYGFIELRNSGVDLQDIASLGNTSSKMLEERYLSEYNPTKMTDLYDRIFNKKK